MTSRTPLDPPDYLSEEEKEVWEDFVQILQENTRFRKTLADAELIQQYVQHKVMRDRAWQEWNKKPERYIRIVTGICADGTTPKIVVKENEHYRILNDCNKKIEKLLSHLKLTPEQRPMF
jgi:P27 family predicted phage terminase small subunit